jgi:hypothetical protein
MAHHHDEANKDVTACYQQGKKARREGIELLGGNPHPSPSTFTDAWDRGWLDEHDLIYKEYHNVRHPETKDES